MLRISRMGPDTVGNVAVVLTDLSSRRAVTFDVTVHIGLHSPLTTNRCQVRAPISCRYRDACGPIGWERSRDRSACCGGFARTQDRLQRAELRHLLSPDLREEDAHGSAPELGEVLVHRAQRRSPMYSALI
eukprot:Opistho-2@87296